MHSSLWIFQTVTNTWALVQAFVSCQLDYCNSLLAGVTGVHLQHLESIQNAAARLVSGARHLDHITPVLASLHWLPVCQQIVLKMAVLLWKHLHGVALTTWLTSVFSWPLKRVISIYALQHQASRWFQVLGHLSASRVLQSHYRLHGTVCQHQCNHQI